MSQLLFSTPSKEWIEGLPLGNGRIGFMAYGLPGEERFACNADSLFRNHIRKDIQTAALMPELRRLVLDGRGEEADARFAEAIRGLPPNCNPYQPFMDISVTCPSRGDAEGYRRSIDLDTAVAGISYRACGGRISWRMFASAADQLLVLERVSEKPDDLHVTVSRESDPDCEYTVERKDDGLFFHAAFREGTKFAAGIQVLTDGRASWENGILRIRDARKLEMRLALATSFETPAPAAPCETALRAAGKKNIEALLRAHVENYRTLYGAMTLSLGEEDARDTETLYRDAFHAPPSPKLYEQLFCFARYLLISSSRPGSLPVNLQGLWNHDLRPMWDCGYTTDMNVQMAYWMAEPANLSECHTALFDWIDSQVATMERRCREIFGVENGAYIPQYTDAFMVPTCWERYAAFQVLWSGAAAWLASHYYTHWQYTGDDDFARTRAFPMMKRCMNFYVQMLTPGTDGKYLLAPACNPENWARGGGQLVNTAVMDISLVHELARNLLEMNERLHLDDPMASHWARIDANMPDYPIDEEGCLREWVDIREPIDPGHRHLSHLYGLFPSSLFRGDARLEQAARKALDRRLAGGLGHSSSWSFAWYACLFARLGEGERAIEFMDHLVRGGLLPNLLTVHNDWRAESQYSHMCSQKIFQIDALFGFAAALCEMLVSANDSGSDPLPRSKGGRLPERFARRGSVRGLRVPGTATRDFSWKDGRAVVDDLRDGEA